MFIFISIFGTQLFHSASSINFHALAVISCSDVVLYEFLLDEDQNAQEDLKLEDIDVDEDEKEKQGDKDEKSENDQVVTEGEQEGSFKPVGEFGS